ncbi:MAG: ABC transporter permease [Clostridiales bacterium]|nr:ABC transporter permease [Clostridiales bacterium]
MNVSNKKCIRRLSFRTLRASKKRNLIAILAIALTTVLFTSLFTIVMSLNDSYQEYTFRQIGGYNHGSFKEVTEEQIEEFSSHPKIRDAGVRTTIGYTSTGVFSKVPAELSYMDENMTKWSYCTPTEGRAPSSLQEIAMDRKALELLGIEPELGAQVSLTWTDALQDKPREHTDTFTLVGWWEFDSLSPVHFINLSKEYTDQATAAAIADGYPAYRTDLNVMLASSVNIRGVMESIDTDLGYQWEDQSADNCVRIGVNWGYTSAELASNLDPQVVLAIVSFILLVIFTGYLIIYNIFRISVSEDIRFYGLLKTIGVTPRQLRRIIRHQALGLAGVGIPVGVVIGYGIGALLTPTALSITDLNLKTSLSLSPVIFVASALFSLITVFLSCLRPGHLASKVSPIEATKYTEVMSTGKKQRSTRGARVHQMAWANLGRSKGKTILVVVSLSLAVTLLTILYTFTTGFDMEKYLNKNTAADFLFGSTRYFQAESGVEANPELEAMVETMKQQLEVRDDGCAYTITGYNDPVSWVPEKTIRQQLKVFLSPEEMEQRLSKEERRGDLIASPCIIEGMDSNLFDRVTVLEGDLNPLFDPTQKAIAIQVEVDDYGNPYGDYPEIGSKLPVTYVEEGYFVDRRTGELCDDTTPTEFLQYTIGKGHDVEYTVCALVEVPSTMGFRYAKSGYTALLPVNALREDSALEVTPLFYLFDTPNAASEAEAEKFLSELTEDDSSEFMYESKETVRKEFENFQQMFLILGGILCFIISLVGILNFFNAIMTGILSRKREFAVLQSIGMTGKQLKQMLIYEGLFYALAAIAFSLVLSLALSPLVGYLMENMFWFYTYRLTVLPVVLTAPVFLLLGAALPMAIYRAIRKATIVERLRENE